MPNNCLMTKLKDTVNNSSLLKVGEISFVSNGNQCQFNYGTSDTPIEYRVISGSPVTLRSYGSIVDASSMSGTLSDGSANIIVPIGTKVALKYSYQTKYFGSRSVNEEATLFDVANFFKFRPNIKSVEWGFDGDISMLSGLALEGFDGYYSNSVYNILEALSGSKDSLQSCRIYNIISEDAERITASWIGSFKNLSYIRFEGITIGDITPFVQARINAGITRGSADFYYTYFSVNGDTPADGTVNWDGINNISRG